MPQTQSGTTPGLGEFLTRITAPVPVDPKAKRYLIVVVGDGIHLDASGKPAWKRRKERPYLWPDQRDEAIATIEGCGQSADVWICPYLMKTDERHKGNAAWRQLVHTDCDKGVDLPKARKAGGFVVWSGTVGHGHVYVPLSYTLRPEQHRLLCAGLCGYLDGDTSKVNDNDLLRPPGTLNFKNTLYGGPPLPVTLEQP